MVAVTRQGVLQAKVEPADGGKSKWEARLWRLDGNGFASFDVEDEQTCKSRYPLSELGPARRSKDKQGDFSVYLSGTKLKLRAYSEQDAQGWCDALRQAVEDVENVQEGNDVVLPPGGTGPVEDLMEELSPEAASFDVASKDDMDAMTPDAMDGLSDLAAEEDALMPVSAQPSVPFDYDTRELVRSRLKSAAIGLGGKSPEDDLRKLLKKVDKDCSGAMSLSEMRDAVRRVFRISKDTVSDEQVLTLFHELDSSGDGVVELEELVKWVGKDKGRRSFSQMQMEMLERPTPKQKSATLLNHILGKIRTRIKLKTKGGNSELLCEFLQMADASGNGSWELREMYWLIRECLKFGQKELSDTQIVQVFKALDPDNNGSVTIDELQDFVNKPCGREGAQYKGDGCEAMSEAQRAKVKAHRERLKALYESHRKKLDKQEAMVKAKEVQEMRQLAESKCKALMKCAKKSWTPEKLSQNTASERLYNNFFEIEDKLRAKQRYYEEQERLKLQAEMQAALPTRNGYQVESFGSAIEAGERLYLDAERREMQLQAAKEAREIELEESMRSPARSVFSASSLGDGAADRNLELYNEAEKRKARMEYLKQAHEAKAQEKLDAEAVGRARGQQPVNNGRIEELFHEAAERQKRLAKMVADKQRREDEEAKAMMAARRKTSVDISGHPRRPLTEPLDSSAKKRGGPQEPDTPKKSEKKLCLAEHLVVSLAQHIRGRCACSCPTLDRAPDCKQLVKPLKDAIRIYREAFKNCEATPGFYTLCARPSMRLFQERLLPEGEGWSRCIEPDPIWQVEERLGDLLESAHLAQATLKEAIAGVCEWDRSGTCTHPEGLPIALYASDPGVKSEASAEAKAMVRYGPVSGANRYKHLLDLARLLLVFATCETLLAGLDQILRTFEVVDVRNYFQTPNKLGARYIDVLVVIPIEKGEDRFPHVCELRLQELCYHKATVLADSALKKFEGGLRKVYSNSERDLEAVVQLARKQLMQQPTNHYLRVFRCLFAKKWGTTVCGWRRALCNSNAKVMHFSKFREVCNQLTLAERATEFWQSLDATMSGCISLFELDPEATTLLIKLRTRILAISEMGTDKEVNAEAIMSRMSFMVRSQNPNQLEVQDFRMMLKPLGFSLEEADRCFAHLDFYGGTHSPAVVRTADIAWLLRLPQLVDVEAIMLTEASKWTEEEKNRHITSPSWGHSARMKQRDEILKWSLSNQRNTTLTSPSSTRARSQDTLRSGLSSPITAGYSSPSVSSRFSPSSRRGVFDFHEASLDTDSLPSSPGGHTGGGYAALPRPETGLRGGGAAAAVPAAPGGGGGVGGPGAAPAAAAAISVTPPQPQALTAAAAPLVEEEEELLEEEEEEEYEEEEEEEEDLVEETEEEVEVAQAAPQQEEYEDDDETY
eukprot:TRINITY_DN29474_c0_g1_i1.p1 TRINITY_DN29474_c0_g1~~TRINITY_DN29474_c0_g1_i1.p1  ORF type:complete len:1401 (-),score=481.33 TRINITY_DN29474_c0_g1_i1:28-4230(-)